MISLLVKVWYSQNMETYYQRNKQKCLEYGKKYRDENREKHLEWCREYQQKKRAERTEYRKKYRATEKGKAATLKAVQTYEAKNPDRKKAWNIANKISKKPCAVCGKTGTHRHHPDINKPMEVIFLCPLCHKRTG